ncbi:MAG TPA: 2-hydroxyacyl-CoA dehydratase family protein [Deltaproteobacteria bacterium]|nr:2-hydroxyacyl-CoA dehydratase family protein [Deltaproteobacteria bacterium]
MREREQAILRLKRQGRHIVGCFPLYAPLELLHSFGLTPVVLWGFEPAGTDLSRSDRHLQNYSCQVARCLTEVVLENSSAVFDALFMYNACDTLRNLPEIMEAGLAQDGEYLRMFKLHVPAVPRDRTGAQGYLKERISTLIAELEGFTQQSFSPQGFAASVELYARHRRLCREAEELCAAGRIPFADLARNLELAHFSDVEEHIALLEKMILEARRVPLNVEPHKRIMVSGIKAPPSELMASIEANGMRVVANDIATLARSYGYCPTPSKDPGEYYCDFYFNHYPCTTILPAGDRRIELVKRCIDRSRVQGWIFFGEKFCEYEYFEIPFIKDMLRSAGVDVLFVELGADDLVNLMPVKTRIEAFAEMLEAGDAC